MLCLGGGPGSHLKHSKLNSSYLWEFRIALQLKWQNISYWQNVISLSGIWPSYQGHALIPKKRVLGFLFISSSWELGFISELNINTSLMTLRQCWSTCSVKVQVKNMLPDSNTYPHLLNFRAWCHFPSKLPGTTTFCIWDLMTAVHRGSTCCWCFLCLPQIIKLFFQTEKMLLARV